jgi:hypothetical protein
VVEDPARCGNDVGEQLKHRVDRSVVSQRQVHPLDSRRRVGGGRKRLSAMSYESLR